MDAEKCLKSVYCTPSNEGSFGGKICLKEAVSKHTGVRMSDKQVITVSTFNFKQTWLI